MSIINYTHARIDFIILNIRIINNNIVTAIPRHGVKVIA